ncbi:MAG TPA: ROK family protein [Chloroflexota bacterium]|nr:ROK family protein [Chloroflexota bacterium]
MRSVLGAVEGGGTKFVCVIGTSPTDVVDQLIFPTVDPEETISTVIEFFQRPRPGIELAALGVATFGPIELDRASPEYGGTVATTKPGWSFIQIVRPISRRLNVPVGWDTDVNGAVLGEVRWGAGRGFDPVVYLTIGTGINGGVFVNGATVHGLQHPELGHLPMPPIDGDEFPGICEYHGRCLEGVASGPAIAARAGRPVVDIPDEDPIWDVTARYLGYGLMTVVVTVSPRRIILGGGVMRQAHLLPKVRRALQVVLNDYVHVPELLDRIDDYVVPSALGQEAGLYGALVLAERALAEKV